MPESTTLLPGTLLRLNCGSDTGEHALWKFIPESSSSSVTMTSGGVLVSEFTPYFYIDGSSPYDLVAWTSNANESYCGSYTCAEDNGLPGGDSATATVASKCISIQNKKLCCCRGAVRRVLSLTRPAIHVCCLLMVKTVTGEERHCRPVVSAITVVDFLIESDQR